MIRNLKALGLAVMAAFALSAVGATAAQALTADVGAGGQTITGTELNAGGDHKDHTFKLSSGRGFTCEEVLFDGTIENGAEQVIVTPTYSKCFSNETQPTTVTHNECNYRFYGGTAEEGNAHAFHKVTVDLDCPAGKEIEVHVYSSHNTHTTELEATANEKHAKITEVHAKATGEHEKATAEHTKATAEHTKATGQTLCTYKVHEFVAPNGKHENTLTNTTTGTHDVDVTTTVEGIVVTRVHGSALVCGPVNQTAVYTGATTIRAYSDTAHTQQVSLTVT